MALLAIVAIAGIIQLFLLCWHAPDRRAHDRSLRGLCSSCGYTRHGLTPTTRCPECGHDPQSGTR